MWVSFRKLELIPGFHFYITEINSKHQSSFLLSLEVELMFLLAILNRLKIFRWHFPMFANNWINWEVGLLQHVNMKCNNTLYWYVKSFHLTIYCQVFVLYFNQTIFLKCLPKQILLPINFSEFSSRLKLSIIIWTAVFQEIILKKNNIETCRSY